MALSGSAEMNSEQLCTTAALAASRPEMDEVPDEAAMRLLLQQWTAESISDGQVIGGAHLGLELRVFRLRVADLDPAAPASLGPPGRG